ncbi:MAG: tetratricopeptide repeat protein [Pseudanabaena sp. ELA607]
MSASSEISPQENTPVNTTDTGIENTEASVNDTATVVLESTTNSVLAAPLQKYKAALDVVAAGEKLTPENVLDVLIARDHLQNQLSSTPQPAAMDIALLTEYDNVFHDHAVKMAEAGLFASWQESLQPNAERWWWFLKKPVKVDAWDQFDWVWNLITVMSLTGFAANMVSVVPLIFSAGLGGLESLGLMGPGSLLALIASPGGKNSESGSAIKKILKLLGIPTRFQSEFTAVIAIILFVGAYVAKENLPRYYFKVFSKEGKQFYEKGDLRQAQDAFNQSLKLAGNESFEQEKVYGNLGLISESLGDDDEALTLYRKALKDGNDDVLNNMGRVYIIKGDLSRAETFLNMGLQRNNEKQQQASPEERNSEAMLISQYQYRRNLGWLYLQQKRYNAALAILDEAVEIDKKISKGTLGKGMANCFKAKVYESLETPNKEKAAQQWQYCNFQMNTVRASVSMK